MNIEATGQEGIQNWYATGVGGAEGATIGQIGFSMIDSLSVSDLATWIYPPNEQNPALSMPYINFDAFASIFFNHPDIKLDFDALSEENGVQLSTLYLFSQIAFDAAEKQHEIISSVLDGWIEQIREQQEEIELLIKSPEYQAWLERMDPGYENEIRARYPDAFEFIVKGSAEFHQYLLSLTPQQRTNELEQVADTERGLRVGLANVVDHYVQNRNDGDASSMVTLPLLASTLIIGGYMAGNLAERAASTSIGEAMQGLSQQVPPYLVDTAAITVNLFATSILYQATAETLFQAATRGEKPVDAQLARHFAAETIAKVLSNEINGAMLAMLRDKVIGSSPVSHQQIEQLMNMAKIMMSMNALILLYRAEAGWTTPEEIAAMLNGTIPLKEGSEEAKLVALIHEYRTNLPPTLQAAIFASMMTLAEQQTKLEEMLDPLHVIRNALNTEDFDAMVWESTPG